MCGITGLVLGRRCRSAREYEAIREQFSDSLVAAQARGTDAAGLFDLNEGGEHYYYRAPLAASSLVRTQAFKAVLSHVGDNTIAIVGHTRAATTGSPMVVDNNHPIYDAPLIGVHNGVIWNNDELREEYFTEAEVDSAVILSVLNAHMGDGKLTLGHIRKAMPLLEGSWAVAIADIQQDALFVARNSGSPLVMTRAKATQALWFGSTNQIIDAAFGRKGVATKSLYEYSAMRLTRGNAEGLKVQGKAIKRPNKLSARGMFRFPPKNAPMSVYGRHTEEGDMREDWELVRDRSDRRGYPSFYDEGSASAKLLEWARKGGE